MLNLYHDFYSLINLCNTAIFNKNNQNPTSNIDFVLNEATNQTVFPLVYSALSSKYDLSQYQTQYFSIISQNVKVTEEHKKLHKLLCENNIPYVFLKGCASARYYPDPLLRTMGDVDILINPEDTEKTDKLLLSAGYIKYDNAKDLGSHIGYKKENGIVCELHRQINGIPKTQTGDKISELFSDIFEKSVLENGEYLCPCDFHHGLILLLHTATHLTHEGIGLRHLCDWAVFVDHFTDEEFSNIFETPLKDIGLWKFAVILSAASVKYLGCPQKSWIGGCDNTIINGVIADIFSGGNFGRKDYSRYQQIKYIANRENRTIDSESPIKRALHNTVTKAKTEILFVKKHPMLLPFGFILVLFKYLVLILSGKRKLDNKQVITAAKTRKELYSKLELFH